MLSFCKARKQVRGFEQINMSNGSNSESEQIQLKWVLIHYTQGDKIQSIKEYFLYHNLDP